MGFGAIDLARPCGYRDYTIILTLLDTGLRISELMNLRVPDLHLEEGILKVLGSRAQLTHAGRTA